MLIYCDSVTLLYYLDHSGSFQVRAAKRITTLQGAGDLVGVSDLCRLECRVRPIRRGDTAVLAVFDAFCNRPDVLSIPLTRAVYDRATVIRAKHNFKTVDALHLAAVVEGNCDLFLTYDARLARFADIPVEVLP
jgi:predicted nucleic acid-binding protein